MGIIQRNTDPLWLFDGEQLPVADLTAKLVQKSQDRHREIFRDSWSNTPAHLETWSVGLFGTEKKAKRREGRPFLIHLKPNHVSRLHLFGESAEHGTAPRVNTQELLLAHTLDKNPNRGGGRSFDYKHRRGFKEYLTNNSLFVTFHTGHISGRLQTKPNCVVVQVLMLYGQQAHQGLHYPAQPKHSCPSWDLAWLERAVGLAVLCENSVLSLNFSHAKHLGVPAILHFLLRPQTSIFSPQHLNNA